MRLILALIVLLLVGAAGIFGWQQSEILHLRAQVAQQAQPSAALPSSQPATQAKSDNVPSLSADERRFVLSQYRAVLSELNLPTTTASRLQDLLTQRIESALDAQDAARRQGLGDGSPGMVRAESVAIANVDRQIASLLGTEDDRRLVMLTTGVSPQAAFMPAPPAPPVVVNVYNQTQAAPVYADETAPPPEMSDYAAPAPYYYTPAYYTYPYGTFFVTSGFNRPFGERFERGRFEGARPGAFRPSTPEFGGGARLGRRGR